MIEHFTLPDDNERLANLCGNLDSHLRLIEQHTSAEINNRGATFKVIGELHAVRAAKSIIEVLFDDTKNSILTPERVQLHLSSAAIDSAHKPNHNEVVIKSKRGIIRGRGQNQKNYLTDILKHNINFGVGPAGTGKTFLAVASAIDALERDVIRRIVLVRPAVEAGERLGFLPGDLTQKVDPYLRPLYDALYEMLGFEQVGKLIERNVIEIAPLAFMRGRTLNDSFIILDEAQNTTTEQMKMFLTRLGFNSTAVITGDITQVDLPKHVKSGLKHAMAILKEVEGISMTLFNSEDIVRHPLVAKIVNAYEKYELAEQKAETQ